MLRLENIAKIYPTGEVLKDVNWEVKAGDRIGLVGVNGAGKSTQLKIIRGDVEPTSGNVIRPSSLKIGYLNQEFEGEAERTVGDEWLTVFEEATVYPVAADAQPLDGYGWTEGRLDRAVWCGDQLLLASRMLEIPFAESWVQRQPAAPRPQSAPPPTQAVELDLSGRDLGAIWRPRDAGGEPARGPVPFPGERVGASPTPSSTYAPSPAASVTSVNARPPSFRKRRHAPGSRAEPSSPSSPPDVTKRSASPSRS